MRRQLPSLVLLCVGLALGCAERHLVPAEPCTTFRAGVVRTGPSVDKLDLLLMIDNSCSMTEEQASVVTELPRILQVITSGDRDGDGAPDFTPVRSLHVGIVSSDMGLGDVTGIATCDPGFGDDGLMQLRARHPAVGCMNDYTGAYAATPNVFDFTSGGSTTASQFGIDVGCVATFGTDGCGFEFELDAPLKALSLAPTASGASPVTWTRAGYRPPTFFAGTFGHGGDPATNGAFLRPDSVLAIVLVADEDDCSTPEPHIFSPDDPAFNTVDLNLRCHDWVDHLHPVSRYTDGFLGLRANPAMLVYGAITGVPPSVAGMDPSVILAEPAMQEQVNPAMTNQLLPTCSSPGRGVAYPARRMTELARQLDAAGAYATVQSICAAEFGPAFDEIVGLVADALTPACLARELAPDAEGFIDCDVDEVLPAIGSGAPVEHCADLGPSDVYTLDHVERTTAGSATIEREVCRVRQVGRGRGHRERLGVRRRRPAPAAGLVAPRGRMHAAHRLQRRVADLRRRGAAHVQRDAAARHGRSGAHGRAMRSEDGAGRARRGADAVLRGTRHARQPRDPRL